MRANSKRLLFLACLACLGACTHRGGDAPTPMSREFGVCIFLQAGDSYHVKAPGLDFEQGLLKLAGKDIDVYIGNHPSYDGVRWNRDLSPTRGFVLVGTEHSRGKDRVLLGNKRADQKGLIYVQFMGVDLAAQLPVLTRKDLVVDCGLD